MRPTWALRRTQITVEKKEIRQVDAACFSQECNCCNTLCQRDVNLVVFMMRTLTFQRSAGQPLGTSRQNEKWRTRRTADRSADGQKPASVIFRWNRSQVSNAAEVARVNLWNEMCWRWGGQWLIFFVRVKKTIVWRALLSSSSVEHVSSVWSLAKQVLRRRS